MGTVLWLLKKAEGSLFSSGFVMMMIYMWEGSLVSWIFFNCMLMSFQRHTGELWGYTLLSTLQPYLHLYFRMTRLMDCTVKSYRESSQSIFNSDPVEYLLNAGKTDLNLPEFTLQSARDLCSRDDHVTLKQVMFYMINHYLALRWASWVFC